VASYRKLFGVEPKVKAIHAGLECGLFTEKFPGLDMVSFGPTLRGVHAPGERLDLASLDKFVALLTDVVTTYR
jgi:dipeptidase D